MIIEIAGGGYPVHGWWFILIPAVVLVVGIVCAVKWDRSEGLYSPGLIAVGAFLLVTYALVFGPGIAPEQERTEHDKQKTAALQEQGFGNVDLENDSFTASQDGEYFSGSLLEIAENTFQVVEKVEVK